MASRRRRRRSTRHIRREDRVSVPSYSLRYYPPPARASISLPALPRLQRAMTMLPETVRKRVVRKLQRIQYANPLRADVRRCIPLSKAQKSFGAGSGSGRRRPPNSLKRASIAMERMQKRTC